MNRLTSRTASRTTSPTADLDLDAQLRRIDPTSGAADRSTSAAAQAMLATVLATPREDTAAATAASAGASAVSPRVPTRRRAPARRRWVLAGLAATAVAGAVALVPTWTGSEPAAFATWTPTPTPLAPAESAALQARCLSGTGTTELDGSPSRQVAGLAEARGLYTYTLVATAQGVSTCFALDPAAPGYDDPEAVHYMESWRPAEDLPEPAAEGTTVMWGGNAPTTAGTWTWATGRAGAQVAAVELIDADGRRVQASLSDGYFAAWWPGTGYGDLRVRTTLVDGTTATRQVTQGDR